MSSERRAKVKNFKKQRTFNISEKMHNDMMEVCDTYEVGISEFIRESIIKNIEYYRNSKK